VNKDVQKKKNKQIIHTHLLKLNARVPGRPIISFT